jgi:AraC-like DNA-binding protein
MVGARRHWHYPARAYGCPPGAVKCSAARCDVTPKQLLMKKRIDKACTLLEETIHSITEVSGACGYADHSVFTRQFKAATHITPALYRATHKTVAPAV